MEKDPGKATIHPTPHLPGKNSKMSDHVTVIRQHGDSPKRRRRFEEIFVENGTSSWRDSDTYLRAAKIPKLSVCEFQPTICLESKKQTEVPPPPPPPPLPPSTTTTTSTPAVATTTAIRTENSSGKKRLSRTKDPRKRNSYVTNTSFNPPSRPLSIASPPNTAPMTSSLTEFNFQVDLVSCLSTDSAISSSSSVQESSSSLPSSSFASLSIPHSSSTSLQSLETSPVPQPPHPSPTQTDSPAFLRHLKAGRHSTREEVMTYNPRMTQLPWTSDGVSGECWSDLFDDVNCNFQSLTIDRKCLRDKAVQLGRKKFNLSPQKGVEYLVHLGLIRSTPEGVAEFLYKGEGLRKTSIGDFLGERNDFNIDVLKAFVGLHRFSGMLLVQALRQFLWKFRLPGESQKIDRIMEHFASKFCSDNPNEYANPDTCYILSYALVMLNTSLHNVNVKDKLTFDRFEGMVKMICTDEKITGEMLAVMYKSIKREPIKFPEESGQHGLLSTFFNPTKEGWLYKKSEKYNQWQKRWFVLNDGCLYYFTYKTDQQPRVIVPLENLRADFAEDKKKDYCFAIACVGRYASSRDLTNDSNNNNNVSNSIIKSCKTQPSGKVIQGTRTNFKLSASTAEDCLEWINSINKNVTENPLQKLVVQRREKSKPTTNSRSTKRFTFFSSSSIEEAQQTAL